MQLTHIVAATDESDAGRQAVWTALELAADSGARVTLMRVVPFDRGGTPPMIECLQRWVESDLPPLDPLPPIHYCGGRRPPRHRDRTVRRAGARRSPRARPQAADSRGAVAGGRHGGCRGAPEPDSLSVRAAARHGAPPRAGGGGRLRAGDEGAPGRRGVRPADRGGAAACSPSSGCTRVSRLELARAIPAARSTRVRSKVQGTLGRDVEVRRGEPAEQILAAVQERKTDVLVLGCHLGGPAGVIEAGSTARQVTHTAPCAVLTVPL